ncbi:MAG: DUF2812 domain-containing protein [Clostridiales bacterium]|nr:DUF2812 domain-containing protein [Clostridiales bacterium]
MNFKITTNYLNIINYPYIAKYLEDMARKGWLLKKVFGGVFFIFKRIKPEDLEFSISPYEVETAFTRKSKEELKEFETVCENVGWNYCTKSFDLFIYYKERHSNRTIAYGDEVEYFKTEYSLALAKSIAKRLVKSYLNEGSEIIKVDESLWNVDEAYIMREDKYGIVLRDKKEVFFLAGRDFTDKENVDIVKGKLGLD